MMRLMKLAGFLVFLAVPLLLATVTQADLIPQYFEAGWSAYPYPDGQYTAQGGPYNLNNYSEGWYTWPDGSTLYVGAQPQPTNGHEQQISALSGASYDLQNAICYARYGTAELWLTADTAQTVTLSFKYFANVDLYSGHFYPPPVGYDPDTGVARVYVKVGGEYYLDAEDNADAGSLSNQIFTDTIYLNPGDKLIIGCYTYAGWALSPDDTPYWANSQSNIQNLQITPIPGGFLLFGSGLLSLAALGRWRLKRKS